MTETAPAGEDAPVPLRINDRVTFAHTVTPAVVTGVHRDVKNGRPGVDWKDWTGTEHWSYLNDVASVNGRITDYAVRYAWPEAPLMPPEEELQKLPVTEQARHILMETRGVTVRMERLPVPEVFDPAEEVDRGDDDMVGLDVQMSFRMYVDPKVLGDADELCQAFENWLHEEYKPRGVWNAPGMLGLVPAGPTD